VKLTVLCGVSDGGEPCRKEIGAIWLEGFPDHWFRGGNFDPLSSEERHHRCPKHGAMQIHEEDLLRRALNPGRLVIMARSPRQMGLP
jgi:hypothetical protein